MAQVQHAFSGCRNRVRAAALTRFSGVRPIASEEGAHNEGWQESAFEPKEWRRSETNTHTGLSRSECPKCHWEQRGRSHRLGFSESEPCREADRQYLDTGAR